MRLDDRDLTRLQNILRYSQEAVDAMNGMSYQNFASNRVLILAMERCCEIIGEAGRYFSDSVKAVLPQDPMACHVRHAQAPQP